MSVCDKCNQIVPMVAPEDRAAFPYISVVQGADYRKRREIDWFGIVIHHTGVGGREEIDENMWAKLGTNLTEWLTRKDENYVSSHFVIPRAGKIVQIVEYCPCMVIIIHYPLIGIQYNLIFRW